jgi:hypothetical protein
LGFAIKKALPLRRFGDIFSLFNMPASLWGRPTNRVGLLDISAGLLLEQLLLYLYRY